MIPSDPPTYKFRWPAEWSEWRGNLWSWLKRTQPIPDPASFTVAETPHGRFFSLRAPVNALQPNNVEPDFVQGPLYIMGSSQDGSISPNTFTAPPARSAVQADTFESWNPPIVTKVNITSVSAANPAVVTATAHGMPSTGGPWEVFISGSNAVPDINGVQWATYIDANSYSIPVNVTTAGTATGWVALRAVGVQYNEFVRFYKVNGVGDYTEKVFTRTGKFWDPRGVYVSGETVANEALITGSGSANGGLP